MHELALSQQILDTVKPHVGKGRRLEKVVVECGVSSGVVPSSLDFCFSIVAKQMGFDGATLTVHLLRADAVCPMCGTRTRVESLWDACPSCDHAPLSIRGGSELRIAEIEVKEV